MTDVHKQDWETYLKDERSRLEPLLHSLGFTLDEFQPHVLGERYLMQAVTTSSGKKLVFLGSEEKSGRRVVVKATRDASGAAELRHERLCRRVLGTIRFAYRIFFLPEEILFIEKDGYTLSVQAYIAQDHPFLERPVREQFDLALESFKAQEGVHAATYEQAHLIKRTFGSVDAEEYLRTFEGFAACTDGWPELSPTFEKARSLLREGTAVIEQYGGFLTHTDFVPHNFRVVGDAIYLLDHSSLRFGNKYEGWARFLNYMLLYNRELEQALVHYVRDNRTPEESQSLSLMRIYRLGEIICYYVQATKRSGGDLRTLNAARVSFWHEALIAELSGEPLAETVIDEYRRTRDALRSEDERLRQAHLR